MAKFVEEGGDVAVFHQAGIARLAAGEIADERDFGKLLAVFAIENGIGAEPLILAGAGMHVEINAAELVLAVENVERGDGGIPDDGVLGGLEGDAKELAGDVQDALLDAIVSKIGPRGLRIEV